MPDERTIHEDGMSPDAGDAPTIIESAEDRAAASINLTPGGQFLEYTLIEPLKVASGEAELWFIKDTEGQEQVLKLYRWGITPKEEITTKIKALQREHIVQVLTDGEAGGRHYEVLEKIEHGSLVDLISAGQLGDPQLKESVRELGTAVSHLHEEGILHRDIKPANVLVRGKDPLDLVLTDFGISSLSDISLHLTSVNRTAAYCAPEAMQGVVAKASDWWSVGVIVLEMLQGRHPFAGMDERAVNFQLVTKGISIPEDISSDWQLVLKGLLTRDPEKRWGWDEVEQWLAGKRDMTIQYEGDQKEEKKFGYRPYKLKGKEIYDLGELAVYLGENWAEGVKQFGRGLITEWARSEYQDQGMVSDLTDITDDPDLDGDGKLSAALLVMNEELPLFWKGEMVVSDWLALNPEKTAEICQSRLLHYYDQHRQEDDLNLKETLKRVREVLDDRWPDGGEVAFARECRNLAVSLAVDREYPMEIDGELITPLWLSENHGKAVTLCHSAFPEWHKRLRSDNWLLNKAGLIREILADEGL